MFALNNLKWKFKVTSSCTSVYVDGSESRGATKAEVIVKYGTLTGSAPFTVWFPVIPLNVQLDDTKLSQVHIDPEYVALIRGFHGLLQYPLTNWYTV